MAKPVTHELSPKELKWLEQLRDKIWQEHVAYDRANISGHVTKKKYRTEKRALTRQEYRHLERLILQHELPCLPGSGCFGFGFSLTVCGHSSSPAVKPDILIIITGEQLPRMIFPGNHLSLDTVWSAFEPFTHSPRNRELLKFYGFDEPRERSYYDY